MNSLHTGSWLFRLVTASLIGYSLSFSAIADTIVKKNPPPVRVICMSTDNLQELQVIISSPEGRAKINEVKALLASKEATASASNSRRSGGHLNLLTSPRGKVMLSDFHRAKCMTAMEGLSIDGWSIKKMNSDWWLDPWGNDDPPYFDFGPFGSFEGGSYMEETEWWSGEVFEPIFAAAIMPEIPRIECRSQLSTCNTITRNLKSVGLVACSGLVPFSVLAAVVCVGATEYISDRADTQCLLDYATCNSASLANPQQFHERHAGASSLGGSNTFVQRFE
jgi:hypothetical protein